jgi:hypothetical protein
MNREQQEAVSETVREFIDIKYELARYVDDELIELCQKFDKALQVLIKATDIAALVDQ